jgi:hypothetical protein
MVSKSSATPQTCTDVAVQVAALALGKVKQNAKPTRSIMSNEEAALPGTNGAFLCFVEFIL